MRELPVADSGDAYLGCGENPRVFPKYEACDWESSLSRTKELQPSASICVHLRLGLFFRVHARLEPFTGLAEHTRFASVWFHPYIKVITGG
jgi:hypothetical protein